MVKARQLIFLCVVAHNIALMTQYFPIIRNYGDIQKSIEKMDGQILLREVGDLVLLKYGILENPEEFFDLSSEFGALARELRGIAFDRHSGKLISRPFPKFHNINEVEDTMIHNIDLAQDHEVFYKYDGSMVRPLPVEGDVVMTTKLGISDVSLQCQAWIDQERPDLPGQMAEYVKIEVTPVLEWISPDNQVVVQYDEPQLIVLGFRDNLTGAFIEDPLDMQLPRAKHHEGWAQAPGGLEGKLAWLRDLRDEEGVVIRFADGRCIKAKSGWYDDAHSIVSEIGRPPADRFLAERILDDRIDDLYPLLIGRKREYVRDLHKTIVRLIDERAEGLEGIIAGLQHQYGDDRKAKAQAIGSSKIGKQDRTLIFRGLTGDPVKGGIIDFLKKNTNRASKWEAARDWLGSDLPGLSPQFNPIKFP